MKVELTSEEAAEFTPLNRAAVDLLLVKRQQDPESSIPPCWLCMSPEAQQEARDGLVSYLNDQMRPIVPMDEESVRRQVESIPGIQEQIDRWKIAELSLKKERIGGNPRAYFME